MNDQNGMEIKVQCGCNREQIVACRITCSCYASVGNYFKFVKQRCQDRPTRAKIGYQHKSNNSGQNQSTFLQQGIVIMCNFFFEYTILFNRNDSKYTCQQKLQFLMYLNSIVTIAKISSFEDHFFSIVCALGRQGWIYQNIELFFFECTFKQDLSLLLLFVVFICKQLIYENFDAQQMILNINFLG
eukprot:TRINITY_DN3679_c0_g1_i4.p1 TRINITY_DN3679_c0_g1~~TRINITY_DN3679_c0_g1_i4.p1  ORF type:complete len:186 (-),score=-7.19 TRINITY_DN3679_c0_g1_i4:247-804(-)